VRTLKRDGKNRFGSFSGRQSERGQYSGSPEVHRKARRWEGDGCILWCKKVSFGPSKRGKKGGQGSEPKNKNRMSGTIRLSTTIAGILLIMQV